MESVPAGDGDTATERTVQMMCRYINEARHDPRAQQCADYVRQHFAGGNSRADLVWGAYWYVKHCVKLRSDEGLMMELGLPGEQDALISPRVLLRQQNPREDCDGFTMALCSLLCILGIEPVLVTVCASPQRFPEFTHVFCAVSGLNGPADASLVPLDASHMPGPGMMVPLDHILRWQAWDLRGQRLNTPPPRRRSSLNGYVRARRAGYGGSTRTFVRRGLGDDSVDVSGVFTDIGGGYQTPTESPYPVVMDSGGSTSTSNWTGFLQSLVTQGVNLAGKILTPPAYEQTVRDPVTGQVLSTTVRAATPATAVTAAAGGLAPTTWLWIGGGALGLVALLSLAKGGRR